MEFSHAGEQQNEPDNDCKPRKLNTTLITIMVSVFFAVIVASIVVRFF